MTRQRPVSRFLSLALAGSLLLGVAVGCAYRNAMARAEEYAAAQRWRDAVGEYRNALAERPGDADALTGLAAVTPGALAEAMYDGRKALLAGDYETAAYHRDYALGLDPSSADALQLGADTQAQMEAVLGQLLAERRMEEAYGFANRTNGLFPDAPSLPAAYEALRGFFFARADERLGVRDFPAALAALDTILLYEPGLADQVQARAGVIRNGWADDVAAQAKTRSAAGRAGAAASLFARAYEIAGRAGDLAQARELAQTLRQRGMLRTAVAYAGDGNRLATVRPALEAGIAGLAGTTISADAAEAELVLRVETGPASCDQTARTWQGAQSYVAGYNQYENPDYRQAVNEAERLQGAIADAASRQASAQATESQAWAQATSFEQSTMQPIWGELSQLRSQLESVSLQLDGRRRLVAQLEQEIADARARGASEDALLASQMTLGTLRQDVIDMENQVYLAQNRLGELQSQEASRSGEYQGLRAAAESWSAQARSIDGELQRLRAELSNAEYLRQATSPTLVQEIPGTFTYDITEWTRVCGGDFRLTTESRWDGAQPETLSFTNRWQVVDQTNDAFADYGLVGDPLAFSLSDWELTVQADLASGEQLAAAVAARAEQYFAYRWQAGSDVLSSDADGAAEQLLMVYLSAPERIDPSGVALLQAHVAANYGLENVGLLFP